MSTLQVAPVETRSNDPERQVINDFSIQIATVNGSGSQTANMVLMRSIFQMGIPVSGKNMFPSNIAGLPTWFTIRASEQGFIGRKKIYDGILANLLSIDLEEMRKAVFKQFGKRKAKAAELNMGALTAGFDYAAQNLTKLDPFRVEKMNATAGKIIIEGNSAAAL